MAARVTCNSSARPSFWTCNFIVYFRSYNDKEDPFPHSVAAPMKKYKHNKIGRMSVKLLSLQVTVVRNTSWRQLDSWLSLNVLSLKTGHFLYLSYSGKIWIFSYTCIYIYENTNYPDPTVLCDSIKHICAFKFQSHPSYWLKHIWYELKCPIIWDVKNLTVHKSCITSISNLIVSLVFVLKKPTWRLLQMNDLKHDTG